MDLKREKLLNRMGFAYVVAATIGFAAWALLCAACTRISSCDYYEGYSDGMADGIEMSGGEE